MAGAGKKLHGGGARTKHRSPSAQVSDGGYGRPPHPLRLVPGQVFFPRVSNGRRRVFVIVRVTGGRARGVHVDRSMDRVSVSAERLLDPRFYSFQGYVSRRYRTWAYVASADTERASLVVPEWHPDPPGDAAGANPAGGGARARLLA